MDTHLNFRMSSHDKKIIETAAKLKGFKPNTYARQKLLQAAEDDIIEIKHLNTLIVSNDEWETFLTLMEAPIQTNANLKNAFKKFKEAFEV